MELDVKNLSVRYKDHLAVKNLSFSIEPGSIIGLIGANGAGKSTLFKVLSTILRPTTGEILLDGKDIIHKPSIMRKQLSYLPQQIPYYSELTSLEYLRYVSAIKGLHSKSSDQQIVALLDEFHLSDTGSRRLKDFSGGMRQRVGIIASLLGNPKVILVDEPTVGLDPFERTTVINKLVELSRDHIVIMSTHIVSDLEATSNKILMLNSGELIFDGSSQELISAANGVVWEYTLQNGQVPTDRSNISSLTPSIDGLRVRAVSKERPSMNAELVLPNLEDASFALSKGVQDGNV